MSMNSYFNSLLSSSLRDQDEAGNPITISPCSTFSSKQLNIRVVSDAAKLHPSDCQVSNERETKDVSALRWDDNGSNHGSKKPMPAAKGGTSPKPILKKESRSSKRNNPPTPKRKISYPFLPPQAPHRSPSLYTGKPKNFSITSSRNSPPKKPRRVPLCAAEGLDPNHTNIFQIPLNPVRCLNDGTVIEGQNARPLGDVSLQEQLTGGEDVTLVFCIRRAGCGQCREHALQLSDLARNEQINIFGVLKETGVDDESLSNFHKKYFHFPLYKDGEWSLFKNLLGDRKLTVWRMFKKAPQLAKRYSQKNIENIPFGGDLWTQGGVLIFDRAGKLRFVYFEQYGDEIDESAIRWGIDQARRFNKEAANAAAETETPLSPVPSRVRENVRVEFQKNEISKADSLPLKPSRGLERADTPPRSSSLPMCTSPMEPGASLELSKGHHSQIDSFTKTLSPNLPKFDCPPKHPPSAAATAAENSGISDRQKKERSNPAGSMPKKPSRGDHVKADALPKRRSPPVSPRSEKHTSSRRHLQKKERSGEPDRTPKIPSRGQIKGNVSSETLAPGSSRAQHTGNARSHHKKKKRSKKTKASREKRSVDASSRETIQSEQPITTTLLDLNKEVKAEADFLPKKPSRDLQSLAAELFEEIEEELAFWQATVDFLDQEKPHEVLLTKYQADLRRIEVRLASLTSLQSSETGLSIQGVDRAHLQVQGLLSTIETQRSKLHFESLQRKLEESHQAKKETKTVVRKSKRSNVTKNRQGPLIDDARKAPKTPAGRSKANSSELCARKKKNRSSPIRVLRFTIKGLRRLLCLQPHKSTTSKRQSELAVNDFDSENGLSTELTSGTDNNASPPRPVPKFALPGLAF